ncbi:MAG: GNAT family N-acetyltransferase [Hyphomicrobiales bacterium]
MTVPAVTTERLLLRERSPADTEACLAMDREPEVTRFVDGPWADARAHRAFIEARTRGPYADGLGYWTILAGAEHRFIGWVLLIPRDAEGPEIEIGWRLCRTAWGHGYATEAAKPVLRHGFATLGLEEIVADIDPANAASRRVAEKIGLLPVGLRQGKARSEIRYALSRPLRLATSWAI